MEMNVSKVHLSKIVPIHCSGDCKEGDEILTRFHQQLINDMKMPS